MSETFEQALATCNDMGPKSFTTCAKSIEPEWIEQALVAPGTASIRRRKLPAEQVLCGPSVKLGGALRREG